MNSVCGSRSSRTSKVSWVQPEQEDSEIFSDSSEEEVDLTKSSNDRSRPKLATPNGRHEHDRPRGAVNDRMSHRTSSERPKHGQTPSATLIPSISDIKNDFLRAIISAAQSYAMKPTISRGSFGSEVPLSTEQLGKARSRIDWRNPVKDHAPFHSDFSDSSDEESPSKRAPTVDASQRQQLLYSPVGQWTQFAHLPIERPKVITTLNAGAMCEAYIKEGLLGGKRIMYISKTWALTQNWTGFFSELALYTCPQYLRNLQGSVIPTIIGIYLTEGNISVAMELPHSSFWVEASSDMPNHLKEKCVAAFDRIHAKGVLHNDVELRHMLINADGKVAIIDFQESQGLHPTEGLDVAVCTAADIRLENRKVRFKLNYDGAVQKEHEKRRRVVQRHARNAQLSESIGLQALDQGDTADAGLEEVDPDDVNNPIVPPQDWMDCWVGQYVEPSCVVVPGQDKATLQAALARFIRDQGLVMMPPPTEQTITTSAIQINKTSPTKRKFSLIEDEVDSNSRDRQSGSTTSYKRRILSSLQIGSDSRAVDQSSRSNSTSSARGSRSIDVAAISHPMKLKRRLEVLPSQSANGRANASEVEIRPVATERRPSLQAPKGDIRSYSRTTSDLSPPLAISDLGARTASLPIHVPYEGYSRPGGFTTDKPYTDKELSMLRRMWIAQDNVARCKEEGLPYPLSERRHLTVSTDDAHVGGDLYVKRKKTPISLGALKRAREDREDPERAKEEAARKKAKYMMCKERRRRGDISDSELWQEDDEGEGPEGGPILTDDELWEHYAATAVVTEASDSGQKGRFSGPRRGILRRHLSESEKREQQEYETKLRRLQDKKWAEMQAVSGPSSGPSSSSAASPIPSSGRGNYGFGIGLGRPSSQSQQMHAVAPQPSYDPATHPRVPFDAPPTSNNGSSFLGRLRSPVGNLMNERPPTTTAPAVAGQALSPCNRPYCASSHNNTGPLGRLSRSLSLRSSLPQKLLNKPLRDNARGSALQASRKEEENEEEKRVEDMIQLLPSESKAVGRLSSWRFKSLRKWW